MPDRVQQVADKLKLTPEEQHLYQTHWDNLWGSGGQDNADGSRSTVYTAVQEHDGKYYNIPTIWNGQRETEPYTRDDGSTLDVPNPIALSNVAAQGWDKFPSYPDPDTADSRYSEMHSYMEQDTNNYMTISGNWN